MDIRIDSVFNKQITSSKQKITNLQLTISTRQGNFLVLGLRTSYDS